MNKPVIICVDDEVSVLRSLKVELREALAKDYRVEIAENAEDALALVEILLEHGCDIPLMIADYLMPDMRGDELLKQVHLRSPKTLKIMLTGQADLEAVGKAIQHAELYRYIAKPWQAEDLQLTVKEAIHSYLQAQKLAERTAQLQHMNQTLEQQVAERTLRLRQLSEQLLEQNTQLSQEIEQRERVEAALRESQRWLSAITETTPCVVYLYDLIEQCIVYNNHNALFGGYTLAEIQQMGTKVWQTIMHPEDLISHSKYLKRFDSADDRDLFEFEYRIQDKNGQWHWLLSRDTLFTRTAEGEPKQILGAAIDITERKRAEAASVLEERNRIAQEIHDILAQSFTGIIVHTDAALLRVISKPEVARTHLMTVRHLACSGLAEARRSVEALRPQLLDEGNLESALSQIATQMFSQIGVQVSCKIVGEVYPLPQNIESHLLRIGQEVLTNASKHAKATEIQVELVYEPEQFILRMQDNGQGFEKEKVFVSSGFGLLNMTQRADRIGAELAIHSTLGSGTEVVVFVNRMP